MIEESDDGDFDFFDIVIDWGESECIKEGITREIISLSKMIFVDLDL